MRDSKSVWFRHRKKAGASFLRISGEFLRARQHAHVVRRIGIFDDNDLLVAGGLFEVFVKARF